MKNNLAYIFMLAVTLTSCNGFLDIKPDDNVSGHDGLNLIVGHDLAFHLAAIDTAPACEIYENRFLGQSRRLVSGIEVGVNLGLRLCRRKEG